MLAEVTFDAAAPGALAAGHRFKRLVKPLDLTIGSYTIVASGFCDATAM